MGPMGPFFALVGKLCCIDPQIPLMVMTLRFNSKAAWTFQFRRDSCFLSRLGCCSFVVVYVSGCVWVVYIVVLLFRVVFLILVVL